jgi:hypothetical protein
MMTPEEIETIRTILQDEVTRWEWELENDTTISKAHPIKYLDDANIALKAFSEEHPKVLTDMQKSHYGARAWPRIYFGRDTKTKKWELWLVGLEGTMNGTTFNDLNSYDDVKKILKMAEEKYPNYLGTNDES